MRRRARSDKDHHETTPDLLFLDIQMPEINGFEVLQAITLGPMPAVIFVTAFDQHALKAFEVHALDYLLKPFRRDRFKVAIGTRQDAIGQGGERMKAIPGWWRSSKNFAPNRLI